MAQSDGPNSTRRDTEQFWTNPIWWLTSKALTTLGVASPVAGAVVFCTKISDLQFQWSAWYIWLLAAIIIAIIPLTILNYISSRYLEAFLNVKSATDSLSGQYLLSYLRKSGVGLALTCLFTVCYWIYTDDMTSLAAIPAYSFLVFGYLFVILFRIRTHDFGLNSVEAEELLAFAYSRDQNSGPTLRRLNVPYVQRSRSEAPLPEGRLINNNNAHR